MKLKYIFTFLNLCLVVSLFSQNIENQKRREELLLHVKSSPKVKIDYVKVTDHLVTIAKSDLEKAELIYLWLCENIGYDAINFQKGTYPDPDPKVTMKNRKGVCSGYANLFKAMGGHAGLEIEVVSGYSKGYGYKQGTKFKKTDHAWNLITLGDKRIVVDATWGSGYVGKKRGKLHFTKRLNYYWFNTRPYEFIFTHLPEYPSNKNQQLINSKLTLTQYENLPSIRNSFFESGVADAKKILNDYRRGIQHNLPETYDLEIDLDIIKAPLEMSKGKKYRFKLKSTNGKELAVIFKSQFVKRVNKNDQDFYSFDYTPTKKGELKISIQYPKEIDPKEYYWGALVYEVKK